VSVVVSFHRLAAAEYVAARRWYARRSPAAEARFVGAVQAEVQQIAANPGAGSPSVGRCRWVKVRRYPYLLHYEQTGPTTAEVYALAHARRRPGYWTRRVNRP
jgi:plasmid stabilization system protein ParE